MSKINEARAILAELNVPSKQQSDLCCLVLLAMSNIKEADLWASATNEWVRIHDVIVFVREFYNIDYAENRPCTISEMLRLLKITVRLPIVLTIGID